MSETKSIIITLTILMKKLLLILPVLCALMGGCSNDDEDLSAYAEWMATNNDWVDAQAALRNSDGTAYYTKVVPEWNTNAYVLIHYFNDRSKTAGNLSPLYNSTVAVKYSGRLYDNTPFDSSFKMTDSLYVAQLSQNIVGWWIGVGDMRVGDSARVVIPAAQGYGAQSSGTIPPFSALQFDIKLVDIPYYQEKP